MKKKVKIKASEKLTRLGKDTVGSIRKIEFPHLDIPSRSIGNIVYDKTNRYFVLGPNRGIRSAGSLKQVKKFAQLMCAADFSRELIENKTFATLREMYYTAEGWDAPFGGQGESDTIVEDLEACLGLKREDLGLVPEEDGAAVYGNLTIKEENVRINATKAGRGGYTIPPTIDEVELAVSNVKCVIAIETMGMYHRLVQEKAYKKFNALLVGLKGQAARATRRFLKRAHDELGLPIHLFCDGDPFGFHIAMVIISGSANLAYINHELAVPDAQFIGVTASDIIDYKLPTDKLRELDVNRLKQIQKDPRYSTKFWQEEIKKMLELGKKAEQQAFSKYGLNYVVKKYLPAKLGLK